MLTQDAIDYLETSPLTADIGETPDEEISARLEYVKTLPDNLQDLLQSEDAATALRQITENQMRLNRDQTRHAAGVLRAILLGERSAATFQQDLQNAAELTETQTLQLSKALTQRFITPHYFQIARLYEKKHGRQAVGSRQEAVGTDITPPPAPPPTLSPSISPTPARTPPPRVVDLRNGAIPSRLPPPPREAPPPGGAEWGPPPVAPREGAIGGRPLVAPEGAEGGPSSKPSVPPGPSAEDLLDNLGKRPALPPTPEPPSAPMLPTRPPGGTHGPLPISPSAPPVAP